MNDWNKNALTMSLVSLTFKICLSENARKNNTINFQRIWNIGPSKPCFFFNTNSNDDSFTFFMVNTTVVVSKSLTSKEWSKWTLLILLYKARKPVSWPWTTNNCIQSKDSGLLCKLRSQKKEKNRGWLWWIFFEDDCRVWYISLTVMLQKYSILGFKFQIIRLRD